MRAAGLRGLPELVDSLGGDAAGLLARFGTTPAALGSDDALVPALAAARMLEAAAAECGCPDLGLRLAGRQDAAVLGPLAVAVAHAATFGEALDTSRRFLFVHSPALAVALIGDPSGRPGVAGVLYGRTDGLPLPPQAVDLGLGLLHRITLMLHGGPYGLRSVHLPHAALADIPVYVRYFGTSVRFGMPAAVLRVPRGLATTPLPGGNQRLHELAVAELSRRPVPGPLAADRVRQLLTRALGTSPTGIAEIGALLRLHPRTLQRRLAAEGTSYERILDGVRRDAAHRLIVGTALPFTQITAMVGLAEQSALSRAVRRWFGVSPRALRATAAVPPR